MKVFKYTLSVVCATLLVSGLLTACHTIHGAGQDVQAGGKAISRAAANATP